jgi:hypothetical protein
MKKPLRPSEDQKQSDFSLDEYFQKNLLNTKLRIVDVLSEHLQSLTGVIYEDIAALDGFLELLAIHGYISAHQEEYFIHLSTLILIFVTDFIMILCRVW